MAPGERKLKLGMVGCGMMGQFAHLRNYVAIPDCEVVALAELRPKLRRLVAETAAFYQEQESAREAVMGEEQSAEVMRTEEEWEKLRSLGYVQ